MEEKSGKSCSPTWVTLYALLPPCASPLILSLTSTTSFAGQAGSSTNPSWWNWYTQQLQILPHKHASSNLVEGTMNISDFGPCSRAGRLYCQHRYGHRSAPHCSDKRCNKIIPIDYDFAREFPDLDYNLHAIGSSKICQFVETIQCTLCNFDTPMMRAQKYQDNRYNEPVSFQICPRCFSQVGAKLTHIPMWKSIKVWQLIVVLPPLGVAAGRAFGLW